LGSVSSLVSEKKIFEISANQSILLALAAMNDHWKVLYKDTVFYADQKSKMAATIGKRLTLYPMGKCSNAFFSETTNMMKAKLYMNVHWMVLYKLYVFCSDMRFKMAATAELNLTHSCAVWFQLFKWFQRRSVLKHFSYGVQC
jgi:hypothetical protein